MDEHDIFEEPKKNWWQRNWKWFVPTGCLTLIALFIISIITMFFTVTAMLKESAPYVDAYETATTNRYVIEQLGEPIEQSALIKGQISVVNNNTDANIRIPLKGSKGEALLHVIGSKRNEQWKYSKMKVYFTASKDSIDLLRELQ
ncbi:cytochrome c oxidase assembly factor Coa1 family protein [Kordia jejudonensis]|uniref:cytochrome c oxidase assembly factor Coa1 family protein n=1 Tax=Kordia jejudonensis TaxID=1348245 RepID=UPI000629842A|nr:cytochrome c oxidase assembly factor Coa1 family protein [Kordia jejudonensis]